MCIHTAWLKCLYARVIPSSCHPWWALDRPFLVDSSSCLSPCFCPSFTSSLPHSTCTLTCTPSSMWTAPRETPAAPSPNEEYCPLAIYHPPTHSGGNLVDPSLQDNVLLPDDFAEYICHIENAFEMHTIIKNGLIRGGKRFRKDRQSVFFTAANPMYARQDLEEVEYDLDKTQNRTV